MGISVMSNEENAKFQTEEAMVPLGPLPKYFSMFPSGETDVTSCTLPCIVVVGLCHRRPMIPLPWRSAGPYMSRDDLTEGVIDHFDSGDLYSIFGRKSPCKLSIMDMSWTLNNPGAIFLEAQLKDGVT